VHTFPADEEVPLDGVVRGLWREAVVEKDAAGRDRVNRVTYEIAELEALRERLHCKGIWVVGANRLTILIVIRHVQSDPRSCHWHKRPHRTLCRRRRSPRDHVNSVQDAATPLP
jgi:hypothetical protein